MKKVTRVLSLILAVVLLLGLTACGGEERQKGKVKISFWAEVSSASQDAMLQIVKDFNASHPNIVVTLVPQTDASGLANILRGSNPPDVIMVDDRVIKSYVSEGYLEKLDTYIAADTNPNFNLDDMWESSVERFRYNAETGFSGTGADYYAVPAGNNPTFIYYNVDLFQAQNINIISVPENEISGNLLPHGYYVYDTAPVDGMTARADGKYHVFNNRIPMNWEELVALSKIFTKEYNSSSSSTYGFMNEWWFSHGWSVGGDCLEWDEASNQYIFALGDESANYLVTGEGVTVNGTQYAAGQILSYADKLYVQDHLTDSAIAGYISAQNLYALPSTRDAFTEFTKLSQSTSGLVTADIKGLGVSPSPNAMANNSKSSYFTTGEVAMVCEVARAAFNIGKSMNILGKNWDIAPLYQYREYNEDGTIKTVNGTNVCGKQAGHSFVKGYAIPANAKNKTAAWEFISYIAGTDGEQKLMQCNMTVPNQKDLAYSEEYLNSTENYVPANRVVMADMSEIASVGDWAYVEDGEWISDWSNVLNTQVRNGKMMLEQFFEHEDVKGTNEILKKYQSKKYTG